MQHADFVHLVRLSEHASAEDGASYRRSVAVFATLAYGWVAACVLLAGGGFLWIAAEFVHGFFDVGLAVAVLAGSMLVWTGARALWCRLDPPDGLRLRPADAPELFEALERIRRKVKGPALHVVVLDGEMDARITQRRRWGLFGGARNHLTIGLPLMMAVDRRRLLAVLAHEYAHLRGEHGRFTAWIYRTRESWSSLYGRLRLQRGMAAAVTQGFLFWYFPRFVARSFALARQDEYEADRISAQLLGGEVASDALIEMTLKGDWLRRHFWPNHWAQAADVLSPVGPYRQMQKLLPLPLPEDFAGRSLRKALRRTSDFDDTHPVLRDRLDGLGVHARLPCWSRRPALELLGARADECIATFDRQWARENRIAWKQHHAALGRVRGRIAQLQAQRERNADEWTELGDLQRRLRQDAPVRPCYAAALAQSPHHGNALQGLYNTLAPQQVEQRMACLERLHEASPQHRWWAAQAAVAALEDEPVRDQEALVHWQARLAEARGAEARAWSELTQQPFLANTKPADIGDFERYELEAELARWPDVRCAWLLRRPLREFPARRAYLLVLDVPRLGPEQAVALCSTLEPCVCLPGPVLLLWAGQSPEVAAIRRMWRPLYDTRVLA